MRNEIERYRDATNGLNGNKVFRAKILTKDVLKRQILTIEIIDIECVLLSFFSENFVSTKWRIYKCILVVLDSCGREFCAVARSATVFFVKQSLQKRYEFEILNGKMV